MLSVSRPRHPLLLTLMGNLNAGMETTILQISFYSHWGINNPANGTLDFEGWRGYQSFLDDCMKAGLWVVVRPGPYINAEVSLQVHPVPRMSLALVDGLRDHGRLREEGSQDGS
jgi:hypothetical protein